MTHSIFMSTEINYDVYDWPAFVCVFLGAWYFQAIFLIFFDRQVI